MRKRKIVAVVAMMLIFINCCMPVAAKNVDSETNGLTVISGEGYYDETLQNKPLTRATSAPTQGAPYYPYSASWSNTVNYTYTQYYFQSSLFDAYASGSFKADFYLKNGTYAGSVTASYENGKYHVAAAMTGFGDYYVVLTNTSGSPAKNATYNVETIYD